MNQFRGFEPFRGSALNTIALVLNISYSEGSTSEWNTVTGKRMGIDAFQRLWVMLRFIFQPFLAVIVHPCEVVNALCRRTFWKGVWDRWIAGK